MSKDRTVDHYLRLSRAQEIAAIQACKTVFATPGLPQDVVEAADSAVNQVVRSTVRRRSEMVSIIPTPRLLESFDHILDVALEEGMDIDLLLSGERIMQAPLLLRALLRAFRARRDNRATRLEKLF